MPADLQESGGGPARAVLLGTLSLHDVDAVRKILYGGSVVDWRRLNLTRRAEVFDFVRSVGFDPDVEADRQRIQTVQRTAVSYLIDGFGFAFPPALERAEHISDVFLAASGAEGTRQQRLACAILKVMHIVHHLDARALKYQLAVADRELFSDVERRLVALLGDLQRSGLPIREFSPSVKERGAVISKLLSKRTALAARIYDRLRFRVVVERPEDVLLALRHMTLRLFPFNYVVPDESRNDVVDVAAATAGLFDGLAQPAAPVRPEIGPREHNEYSGDRYRMSSFVADVPVRAEAFIGRPDPLFARLGPVVYVMVEFQLFDAETWEANATGDCSHEAYKLRQMDGVLRRLVL